MSEKSYVTTITCPRCGHARKEIMPDNRCQVFYECKNCGTSIAPREGDCCVFCSYGDKPCPPKQQ